MKKYYLFLCFLCPLLAKAQKKVDLDRFKFSVQFRSLPTLQLDSTYRTYSVQVVHSQAMQSINQSTDPANTVLLEGWRKLNGNGHVLVDVQLGDLIPESVTVEERKINITNKAGVVTGSNTMYYQRVLYSFAAVAHITDYKSAHIKDEVLVNRMYKQVYNSPEFANRALAHGYFLLNSVKIIRDLYNNCANKAMHYLSNQLTDHYGFAEVTSNDYMYVVGSRKHPEYEDNRKAMGQVNEVLFNMNANAAITGGRKQLQPAIEYFESIKKNYSSSSKHDRKIRYASYFNLAVLYYYLDDPEAMMKEANGLILNDYETSVGKAFQATATRLKNKFERSNIYTRHFSIDTKLFKGPDANAETSVALEKSK